MKFVDLNREYKHFKKAIDSRWKDVVKSGVFLFGSQNEELESNMCNLSGKDNAVLVGNCTDAISMLVNYLISDSPGLMSTPVILPNFGAYPTATAVFNITDNVHYVDVKEDFTIDPSKLDPDLKDGIIIPVHLFGNLCDMDPIIEYANKNNHIIIEDCAQAAGLAGIGKGDYCVFSFYPTKNLASMGDGGCVCSNEDLSDLRMLRFYGQEDGLIKEIGVNSRMDEFQAAVVNAKYGNLWNLNIKRTDIAMSYNSIINTTNIIGVYHQYPLLFHDRDKVINIANKMGVPTIIHYPHHYPDMRKLRGYNNEVGFRVNDKILSVPINPFMADKEINKVCEFLLATRSYLWTS